MEYCATNQAPDIYAAVPSLRLRLAFHAYVAQLLTFACLEGEGFIEILPQEWLRPESRLMALSGHDSLDAESALGIRFDLGWTRIVGIQSHERAGHWLTVRV